MSSQVTIFEVGARDGLQNERSILSLQDKLEFVDSLIDSGIRELELGAFVRPDRIPQMADTEEMYQAMALKKRPSAVNFWSLVPNRKGLERALAAGARHLAVFTAATDSFTQENIGMSVEQSLEEFAAVIRDAKAAKVGKVYFRGYVSTAFGCPYEGAVAPKKALKVIEKLADLGMSQISIGDTIGVATPKSVEAVMKPALKMLGTKKTAGHFHDTRGTALANALRALDLGVRTLDSSAGGLGGCPYAPGASGNLATEDLVYMLNGMGMKCGVDLDRLARTSIALGKKMNRAMNSKFVQAYSKATKC